jgi:hypothetical protein
MRPIWLLKFSRRTVFHSGQNRLWIHIVWFLLVTFWSVRAWPVFLAEGYDFALYYSIGELIRFGDFLGIYVSGEQSPYFAYSPLSAPFFCLLAILPFSVSKGLFFWCKPILLFFWPFLMASSLEKGASHAGKLSAVVACVVALPALFEEAVPGNVNTYLLTALFAAIVLLHWGQTFWASFVFAIIAAFKPQYSLFLVPGLFAGFTLAILGAATCFFALTCISVTLFGSRVFWELFSRWLELISIPIASPADVNNMSTNGVIVRLLTALDLTESRGIQGLNLFNFSYDAALTLAKVTTFFGALVAVMGGLACWRLRQNSTFAGRIFAVVSLVTLVVTPVIWQTHYMIIAYPVFCILALSHAAGRNWRFSAVFVSAFVFLALYLAGRFVMFNDQVRVLARGYGLPWWALVSLVGVSAGLFTAEALKLKGVRDSK